MKYFKVSDAGSMKYLKINETREHEDVQGDFFNFI